MQKNNEKSFFNSVKFIASFMKKYYILITIVGLLILATTYFQVVSPKLMGDSIDEMTTYVVYKKTEEIEYNLAQGKGLSEAEINALIKQGDLDKEQQEKLQEASPTELQEAYDKKQELNKLFSMDNASLLAGKGLSEKQKKEVANSDDFTDEEKGGLIFAPGNVTLQIYLKTLSSMTSVEKDSIEDLAIADAQDFYDTINIREKAILKDTAVLETGEWSEEQIQYIKSQTISSTAQNNILNSTVEDLNEAYDNRKIEVNSEKQFNKFLMSLFLLFLSYIGLFITMFFYNFLMASISGNTARDIRKGMFGKIETLSIRFFDRISAGDLLSRFTNDIDNISNALNQSVIQSISQGAMLIGIVIMMFKEDTTQVTINFMGTDLIIKNILVWTMFAFAIVAILSAFLIIKKARHYVSQQQNKLGDLNGYIDERISGQKVIISYGLEKETLEEFDEYNEVLKNTSIKGQVYSGVLMPLMQGFGFVNLGFLVFLGSRYVIDGVITIGLLTAFIQYSQRFFNPLAQVVAQYNMLELAAAGANRAEEVFNEQPEVVDSPDSKPINGIDGAVVIENVDFGYDENKLVLKNINLEVKKGQMVALVGPTGSGKTTVMNLMNRFYDVTKGEIRFDGIPIKNITLDTLRKNVGIVLQESIIFSGTIRENIAYGNDSATDEEVIKAATLANLHDFITTLENGYETYVDNNTSMFSTGQKQLMSIARTILTNPDLLILDEATSNVDTVTEEKIQKAMDNIVQNRTSFVIAHRLKTILNADVIIVLKDGEIIEQGNHEELLREEGFYAELYHNQFVVE